MKQMTLGLLLAMTSCASNGDRLPAYELTDRNTPVPRTQPVEKDQNSDRKETRRPQVIDLWDEGATEEGGGRRELGVVQGRYCSYPSDCYEFGPPLRDPNNKWLCMQGTCSALLVPQQPAIWQ